MEYIMKLVKKLMVERVIFPFTFSITDHSPDHPETASPGMLRRLYADFRDDGISAIRNDWRWSRSAPTLPNDAAGHGGSWSI